MIFSLKYCCNSTFPTGISIITPTENHRNDISSASPIDFKKFDNFCELELDRDPISFCIGEIVNNKSKVHR